MVRSVLGALVLLISFSRCVEAQPTPAPPLDERAFGPSVMIERIDIVGNSWTHENLIRRALLIHEGETLRAADPRFHMSRIRLMALGFFSDVVFQLERGSERGKVVLVVALAERSTLTLNQLLWGATEATPLWLGLDVGDSNFLGTGVSLSAAALWARQADVVGARAQQAFRLRYSDPVVLGSAWGVHASLLYNRAAEPYRVGGDLDDGAPANFNAFGYRRVGGVAGVDVAITRLSSIVLDARWEDIDAEIDPRALALGAKDARYLRGEHSQLLTLAVGYERDTRSDPVLSYDGLRVQATGELGVPAVGGDYGYARFRAGYEHWYPLSGRDHVLSSHLSAGVVLGDAPFFERWFVGDASTLVSPRALDLVLSTLPSRNLLDTPINSSPYGELVGSAAIEYTYRLFSHKRRVYGGVLFVRGGAFALGRVDAVSRKLPLDLLLDLGVRLDTEIGIFELTLGNGIGRMPL